MGQLVDDEPTLCNAALHSNTNTLCPFRVRGGAARIGIFFHDSFSSSLSTRDVKRWRAQEQEQLLLMSGDGSANSPPWRRPLVQRCSLLRVDRRKSHALRPTIETSRD